MLRRNPSCSVDYLQVALGSGGGAGARFYASCPWWRGLVSAGRTGSTCLANSQM